MRITPPLLTIEALSKRFGGLVALADLTLCVPEGCVFGLIGPNGAGKTTLFNLLSGFVLPDAGLCRLVGTPLPAGRPETRAALGLGRTFQNIRLFGELSVLENVQIGQHAHTHHRGIRAFFSSFFSASAQEKAEALALLAYVGLSVSPDQKARTLSYGDQRRLEMARALACRPRLLALDEPAAGMNPAETRELATLVQRLRDDGVGVLLIEHDVELVMRVCDRIAVLDFGRLIAQGTPREIRSHPEVIRAYLGRSAATETTLPP